MVQPPFEVWDVTEWEVVADETAGQEEKLWLVQPGTEVRWLFKPPTDKNNFRQGEDWSEKVSGDLAGLINIPCAEIQLAIRSEQPGSISRNLRPKNWEMQSGSLLLAETVLDYQPGYMNVKGRPGHSLVRIHVALQDASVPPGAAVPAEFEAFDVFVGFMVLDAWIANRDRHDENWSILIPPNIKLETKSSRLLLVKTLRPDSRRCGRATNCTYWTSLRIPTIRGRSWPQQQMTFLLVGCRISY